MRDPISARYSCVVGSRGWPAVSARLRECSACVCAGLLAAWPKRALCVGDEGMNQWHHLRAGVVLAVAVGVGIEHAEDFVHVKDGAGVRDAVEYLGDFGADEIAVLGPSGGVAGSSRRARFQGRQGRGRCEGDLARRRALARRWLPDVPSDGVAEGSGKSHAITGDEASTWQQDPAVSLLAG